jgi:hypothetical protein
MQVNQLEEMAMLNEETVYWQAGFSAGQASKNHDAGTARHQREWFSRARMLEKDADRAVADEAYKRGYSEGAQRY